MVPLVDALAAICVRRDKQAYAVTISLSPKQITLFVAGNSSVSKEVIGHLEDIWDSVIQISRDVQASPSPQGSPPNKNTLVLAHALANKIHAFSLSHLKKRLEKR
ncbi:hypothetical protein BOTBODRAFT_35857 [Botryobasidium botryosum FD-172 SS1]|uniref:Uncharacterized protein n=1 Tax=Botryobasidium botryosum (strain FD-172 SS1) TaxID=930990 RepID=A0A067M574_BOTB1|nr:hypothetical protein BOTBODRAFT_35857 [Botryobasidium botryosum FD-172 SS1]